MAMYSALRDAFNDMNNMMIDRQTWNAEHKRRAEMDADNRQREANAEKRRQMQDEITAVQIAKARQQVTPTEFSVYQLGDPDNIRGVMEDPKAVAMMEKAVDDEGVGYKFSPADGGFVAPDGSRLEMSPLVIGSRANAFYGIIDMHQKAPEAVQLNLIELQGQKKRLINSKRKYDNPRFAAKAAEIDTQLSAVNADITRSQRFLDPKSGEMLKYYVNKSIRMRKRAIAMSLAAPELAQEFGRESNSLASSAQLAMKAMIDKPTKTGTKKVEWFAEEDGVTANGKTFKKNESFTEFIPVGAEGAMIREGFSTSKVDKDSSAGKDPVSTRPVVLEQAFIPSNQILPAKSLNHAAMDAANDMYITLIEANPPANKAEDKAAQLEASKQVKKKHNAMLDMYQKLEANRKKLGDVKYKELLRAWESQAEQALGYMPTKPLNKTTRRTTKR